MHAAVVGHVEWVEFARVPRVPAPGTIIHATERWEEPAGGGAVAAVQLANLVGEAAFFTALADDDAGRASADLLSDSGLEVFAAARAGVQRRAFTHIDDDGERTITVLGDRMIPHGADPLPWYALSGFDAVYFCGGDAEALAAARAARLLVVTARCGDVLSASGEHIDVLIHSAEDEGEIPPGDAHATYVVATEGASGGHWRAADGRHGRWEAAPLPGPLVDTYGCGDVFAAGLAYALGAEMEIQDALDLAARCAAAVLTGRGPYTAQITSVERPGASGSTSPATPSGR